MVVRRPGTIPYWKVRPPNLKKWPLFKTSEELWQAAVEYFDWCDENPIPVQKSSFYQGSPSHWYEDAPRPYTLKGLCTFLGINHSRFRHWRRNEEWAHLHPAIAIIDQIIYTQKFEGAAVNIFNAMIVTRDLGLKEGLDHSSSDGSMSPTLTEVQISKLSKSARKELLLLMKQARKEKEEELDAEVEEN